MSLRSFAVTILCFPVMAAQAQQGELLLLVHPMEHAEYILDGKERRKAASQWLRLDVGEHRFTCWAPDHRIWDTTLHVRADERIEVRKRLAWSDEYLAYRKSSAAVGRSRLLWKGLPLLGTLVAGGLTLNARARHQEAYDELKALEASYGTLTSRAGIAYLKTTDLPEAGQRVDGTRRTLVVNGAITCVAALATVYGFWRASRLERPRYEDKERLRFEGLAWAPPVYGTPGQLGLILSL